MTKNYTHSKELLAKIADHLIINSSFLDNLGLLHGKMGIVIFFYHYSQYTNNDTIHIGKADAGLLLHVDLGLGLAEAAHGIAAHALGHHAHEDEEGDDGKQGHEQGGVVLHPLAGHGHAVVRQLVGQGDEVRVAGQAGVAGLLIVGGLGGLLLGQVDDLVAVDDGLADVLGGHIGAEIGPGLFGVLGVAHHIEDAVHRQGGEQAYGQHDPAGGLGLSVFGLLARIVFVRIIAYRVHRFGTPPVLVSSV